MAKISSLMDVGKRSLMNNQTALQTVAHNIANKSTEGFSRQRVEMVADQPTSSGRIQIGNGAHVSAVTRTNNPWLEKQIQRESVTQGYMDSRADGLNQVEQVYNEQMNRGLNNYVSEFFNSFRELANNPESLASRTFVRESADAMVKDFQRVNKQLQGVQADLDGQIKNAVTEINEITKEISSLNGKIQQVEVQNIPANDERDRREVLLKRLGEKIDISWAESTDGIVSITAGQTAVLVSGTETGELKAGSGGKNDKMQVYYISSPGSTASNITTQLHSGKIGGALEVRDQVIEESLGKLNNMAYTLGTAVNDAHKEGFDSFGDPGEDLFSFSMAENSGDNYVEGMTLNETVFDDVGRLAVASRPNATGDASVANVISSMQYQKLMDDGRSSFDDYYNSQVGQLGAMSQRASKSREAQTNIIGQLNNIRESVSGVSLDEEATKMIEYQKAYDASARVIRTADEMFDTILNLKRL